MAPKWLDESKETELQNIIQKLTTTGKRTLDEGQMKKLKTICKLSDKYVNCAYYSLMTQLRKDHAEIRFSALLIVNELFLRSSVFRSKLEADFEEFLELVVETNSQNPLPLPLPVAKALKIKGLEYVKNWASKFGEKYIRLPLAVNFLQKCKKMDFDDMLARSAVQRQREQQEREHMDRVMNTKVLKVKSEMDEVKGEISGLLTQMDNCFKLLLPHADDLLFTAADFERSENNELGDAEPDSSNDSGLGNKLRDHGIFDITKTVTIEVNKDSEVAVDSNEDTSPIIDNLRDLEKQISSRYYPMVTGWQKILMKGNNCSAILKEAIDIKDQMKTYLDKCKELKVKPSKNQTDSDDDDFEEVKEKEGYEKTVKRPTAEPQPSCSKEISDIELSYQWKMKHHQDDINDPTTALSNISKRFKNAELVSRNIEIENSMSSTLSDKKNDKKSELLEKAPVLPYDIDLYHWEEEKPLIPEKVRFDSLHKFWEAKDDDTEQNEALIEAQVASLRTRKIDFSGKFEPVKWACRAPLSNGKLCPRKDRYKCPFHGKIIPRDSLGNPSDDPGAIPGPSKESSNSVPDWQDPQLLKDIEAATGVNLKIPEKKGKGKGKGKQKKDGLTNINQINNTVRDRLSKKIIKRYRHYAKKLDETERKRYNDKFGDQWNYY